MNYLSPTLNTSPWTPEEDHLLMQKQSEYGCRWAQIAKFFPNRTDGMVKNRFNRLQRRQSRVQEVNLRCDAAALLWMLSLAPASRPRRAAPPPPPPIEAVPVEAAVDLDPIDVGFEHWTDAIDIDFLEF
jgi:hypothetical protein